MEQEGVRKREKRREREEETGRKRGERRESVKGD